MLARGAVFGSLDAFFNNIVLQIVVDRGIATFKQRLVQETFSFILETEAGFVVLSCKLVRWLVMTGSREVIFLLVVIDFHGKGPSDVFSNATLVAFNIHVTHDVVIGWWYMLLHFYEVINKVSLFARPDLRVQGFLREGRACEEITVYSVFVFLYSIMNIISDTHNYTESTSGNLR